MRLIDADAFIESFNDRDDWLEQMDLCDMATVNLYSLVNTMPTIEERPKGEWIIVKDERYGDNVKCPFCGKELAGTDLYFCCKCGADMRKEKEE